MLAEEQCLFNNILYNTKFCTLILGTSSSKSSHAVFETKTGLNFIKLLISLINLSYWRIEQCFKDFVFHNPKNEKYIRKEKENFQI